MKAKLVNNQLEFPPAFVDYNNTRYSPVPEEIQAQLGYKDVVYTEQPVNTEKYKHYEYSWQDGDVITQVWTLVDDSPESICAQLRAWFDNSYRYYNEKLTRFAALQIEEIIDDEFRGVSYSNLMDLYREAEAVRDEIHQLENAGDSNE